MMKKLFLLLALCLMLPAWALAVTEGVVEEAPPVKMESYDAQAQVSYLPDESYAAGYGDWNPAWEESPVWVESPFDGECYYDVEQRPRMTAGEATRAKALLPRYLAGEIAYEGESILGKMEDVIVGVYALNPQDFDGERAYAILPGPCMTDEQLLAVIDAYHQLGLTFDPDTLSARNCARGGGIEASRFLVEEERARYGNLARLIERGLLDVSHVEAATLLNPKLDSRYFCGLPDFTIRPYRSQTDEEFAAQLRQMGYRDKSGEFDYDGIEKQARSVLNAMGAPLSMEFENVFDEGGYVSCIFDVQGREGYLWSEQGRRGYGASFSWNTMEGNEAYAHAMYDWETKALVSASWAHQKNWDEHAGPSVMRIADEEALAAAKEAEQRIGLVSPVWRLQEDVMYNDWGACRMVRAKVEENFWLTVYVGGDDGKVHGIEIQRGDTVDQLPEEDMPVNG